MERWIVERGLGCHHFGVFLAAPGAPTELGAAPGDGSDEVFRVIRPLRTDDLIDWRLHAHGLNEFLKLSLGIGIQLAAIQCFEIFGKEPCGKLVGSVGSRIEVDGTCDSFEGIGEGGFAVPAAVGLFTAPEVQVGAESDAAGDARQGLSGDELGTCLGQHAFVGLGEALIEQMGQSELEHGIAKEFEALIVGMYALVFITHASVRERELEQRGIAKGVAYDLFQRLHVCSFVAGSPAALHEKSGVTDGTRTRNNQNHNLGLYR